MEGDAWPPGSVQCSSKLMVAHKSYRAKPIVGKYANKGCGYAVNEDHSTMVIFHGSMQVVISSDPTRIKWVSFTQGNIPSNAVVGGHRRDGGDLYVTRGEGRCGFYDPTIEDCAYAVHHGAHSYNYQTFEILNVTVQV